MKYVRGVNDFKIEQILNDKINYLKNFCEDLIPYLLDDEYYIYVVTDVNYKVGDELEKLEGLNIYFKYIKSKFAWNDVKDSIIPLVNAIDDEYIINEIILYGVDDFNKYTIDELDNIDGNFRLLVIRIKYQ